jgi:hypothetical protein
MNMDVRTQIHSASGMDPVGVVEREGIEPSTPAL